MLWAVAVCTSTLGTTASMFCLVYRFRWFTVHRDVFVCWVGHFLIVTGVHNTAQIAPICTQHTLISK